MEPKLERAIIRTFKKMREPDPPNGSEISGIFVNFCYAEYGVHAGLQTKDIEVVKPSNDIWIIRYKGKPDKWSPILMQELSNELPKVTDTEFYSMWLRSSFEDPKNDSWTDPAIREAFKDFRSLDHPLFTHVQYPKDPFRSSSIETDIQRIQLDVENQIAQMSSDKAVYVQVSDLELDALCKEADKKLNRMGLGIFAREGNEGSTHF